METYRIFAHIYKYQMKFFETVFLEEADRFIRTLDFKSQRKILYNIRIAEQSNDPKLFKKITENIWEFRTKYLGKQIRLLAFWDKRENTETLVVASNGFVKRRQKIPQKEIKKAEQIREKYFNEI